MSTSGPADPRRAPVTEAPWSPYPVQDWSQVEAPPSDWVDPNWGPPTPPRPRWIPYLVVALVAALMAGGFFVADKVGERSFSTRAQDFVPEDGAVAYAMRQTSGSSAEVPFVTESARLTGVEQFTAIDFTLGTALLIGTGFDIDSLNGVPFWRTTTTQIGQPEATQQVVRVYQVAGPITLLGESAPGGARTFQPGLVELPADVTPGATWSGSGTAGKDLTYQSEFRAEAAERGCLQVAGTITYTARGRPGSTETVRKSWCPHEGLIREQTSTPQQSVTVSTVRGLATPPTVKTTSEPVAWRDPRAWKNEQFTSVSIDQNLGQGIMTGSPSAVPPVVTASGLVVRATSSSDLVVFTPKTPTEWTSLWRMHPGGTVISLVAFGDVVVATTSQRQVVGYTANGVRLWQHDLDEVALQGPVRVDDTRLALVDGGGTVRVLDIANGSQRWARSLRSEVDVAPVADARAVIVADGSGTVTAFAPDDGGELWQRDLEVSRATLVGDTVVTSSAATLTAVSIADGTSRWLQPLTGTVNALQTFDGRAVLATQLRTVLLAEDGTVQATFEPAELLTTTTGHLVCWGTRQAQVIDRTLAVVTTLDTPDRNLTTAGNWPVADRFGVLLFAGDWSFQTWSDQP